MDRREHIILKRVIASIALSLAALAGAAAHAEESLGGGGDGSGQLLPADQAFSLAAERQADATIVLHWDIAGDYYLYRDRTEFELLDGGDARLGEPRFGPARTKQDPFFGEVAVYYQEAAVRLPLQGTPADGARLKVTYQGCNEPVGVCYPPIERTLALASIAPAAAGGTGPGDGVRSEQGRIAQAIGDRGTWLTALVFVGFGLLLTFTPCVLPMVPILAGVIAGDRERVHGARAGALAAVFVLTMALTYAAVGVLVGLTGASIQAWFQQPWVIATFAGVVVLLALATFGLFDLQVPAPVRHTIERHTRGLGGSFASAGVLGVVSAIIVTPCVTPPLIGALIYVADTGDPITGGIALFALGIGMGLPLIAAAGVAGHVLPRAGAWMNRVRAAFGVLLLGLAIWLLQRVVPVPVAMALWAVLLIVCGVQMGALGSAGAGWPRLWKGVGTVALLYGAILMVGAASGGQSLLQPLRGVVGGGAAPTAEVSFQSVDDARGLRGAIAEAQRNDRSVMLDVYADWCIACKELEAFTFPDPRVQAALGDALLLRADVTADDAGDRALLERFDLYGPPAVLFFGPDGVERRGFRVVGYKDAKAFAEHARRALGASGTDS